MSGPPGTASGQGSGFVRESTVDPFTTPRASRTSTPRQPLFEAVAAAATAGTSSAVPQTQQGGVGLASTFDPIYDSESDTRSAWHESAPGSPIRRAMAKKTSSRRVITGASAAPKRENESEIAAELRSVKAEMSNMRETISRLCEAMAAKEKQDEGRWAHFGQEWFKNAANFRSIEKEIAGVNTAIEKIGEKGIRIAPAVPEMQKKKKGKETEAQSSPEIIEREARETGGISKTGQGRAAHRPETAPTMKRSQAPAWRRNQHQHRPRNPPQHRHRPEKDGRR